MPVMVVTLLNPDGSVHDLTGSSTYTLHIKSGSLVINRPMTVVGAPTAGKLSYAWVAGDWDPTTGLPTVAANKTRELPMEYEVVGGASRMTFPNNGYDTLKIWGDLE